MTDDAAAAGRPGPTPIGRAQWRRRVTIEGRVMTLRVAPTGESALLEVVVADASGEISLVFHGRREIGGVALGSRIRAMGTVARHRGRLAVFNPTYTLLLAGDGSPS